MKTRNALSRRLDSYGLVFAAACFVFSVFTFFQTVAQAERHIVSGRRRLRGLHSAAERMRGASWRKMVLAGDEAAALSALAGAAEKAGVTLESLKAAEGAGGGRVRPARFEISVFGGEAAVERFIRGLRQSEAGFVLFNLKVTAREHSQEGLLARISLETVCAVVPKR